MIPVHLIGELARPLSLSVRLFGNIFSKDLVILTLILMAAKLALPIIPLQLPILILAVLVAAVQALIFTLLTSIYLFLATGEEHA
jgi:F-type H+-transporting ATPase subunit a